MGFGMNNSTYGRCKIYFKKFLLELSLDLIRNIDYAWLTVVLQFISPDLHVDLSNINLL